VKIGLFGGTFNPIHEGHVALAENVSNILELDKMFLIPSKVPPHKTTGIIDADQRLEMVRLTAEGLGDRFVVSDYEVRSDGVSYTLKTLKHFRDRFPDDSLFFACGTDIFATIKTWHKYQELFDYANFIVVSRTQVSFEKMLDVIPQMLKHRIVDIDDFGNESSGKIIIYRMPEVDVSSTEIRDIVENSYRRANLPDAVYEYISENGLYEGR